MDSSSELSRREFLKIIPKCLLSSVHSFTEELSRPSDISSESITTDIIDDGQAKIAKIDTTCCLAWDGGSCQFCYLACPLRDAAIAMEDQKPIINSTICDGCARCVIACGTVNTTLAIEMVHVS